jgi:hypothetical protein
MAKNAGLHLYNADMSLESLGRAASRQHGLVTMEQVLAAGVTRGQLRRMISTGALVCMRRRVYRLNGAPVTWPQAVLAAVLGCGDGAVASHATAGVLWDLKAFKQRGEGIHITAPRQVRLVGICCHVVALTTKEQRTRHGIRVTSAERTILDLAPALTVAELGQCVDDALRRGVVRLETLRQLVERRAGRGRPGVRSLRLVLTDRSKGYDAGASDWERDMDRLWDRLGLPPAIRQYPVSANGHRYILDRAIPDLKIGVEWNGFTTHGTRSAFDYDSDRRADLTAEGWHMVDFTSRSAPERLVAAVRGAIRTRIAERSAIS